MRKEEFLAGFELILFENPEWLADVIKVACRGVLDRAEADRKVSANIQWSLHLLFDHQYGKLNINQKKQVLKALLECDITKGTKFEKEIRHKLAVL